MWRNLFFGATAVAGLFVTNAADAAPCGRAPVATVTPPAATARTPGVEGRRLMSIEPGYAAPVYRAPVRAYRPARTTSMFDAGRKIRGAY